MPACGTVEEGSCVCVLAWVNGPDIAMGEHTWWGKEGREIAHPLKTSSREWEGIVKQQGKLKDVRVVLPWESLNSRDDRDVPNCGFHVQSLHCLAVEISQTHPYDTGLLLDALKCSTVTITSHGWPNSLLIRLRPLTPSHAGRCLEPRERETSLSRPVRACSKTSHRCRADAKHHIR